MYDELPTGDPPGVTVRLRRYMSVAKLIDLLTNQWLYCSPVPLLDDRFEGTFPITWPAAPRAREWERVLREQTRVSCWHEEDVESDALWKIYGNMEEMIAVQSDVGRLRHVADAVPERIAISKIRYIDFQTFKQPEGVPFYPFIYKRNAFQHEREVRLIVEPQVNPDQLLLGATIPPVEALRLRLDSARLLTGVVVSPYGSDWFLKATQSLVARLGVTVPVAFSDLR